MGKKRCPACGSEVEEDSRDCPNCPYSFMHDEHAPKSRRSHPPGLITALGILALVAALGYFAWQGLNFVMERAGGEDTGISVKQLNQGLSGGRVSSAPAGDKPAGPYKLQPPEDAPQASVEPSPGVSEGAAATTWILRGVVYDLDSLEPVAGAAMTFIDTSTDRRLRTVTDELGRYRARVPARHLGGYSVKISKDGYASDYLSPSVEDVKKMPRPARRQLSRGLAASLNGPYELPPADPDDGSLKTDFYVAPLLP